MKVSRDIQSLSTFKRDSAKLLKQLHETGEPLVLTINGKAAGIVVHPEEYDLWKEQERRDTVAAVKRGIEDMKAGRTKPAEEVFREFEKKYGIER